MGAQASDGSPAHDFVALGADVAWPNTEAPGAAAEPGGGRLGELAAWWASVSTDAGRPPQRARLMILGDARPASDAAELAGAGVRVVNGVEADGIAAGVALADAEIDSGTDLLVVAVPDVDVAALTVVSVLTNTEPVKVLPRGTAWDPSTWMANATAVRDSRRVAFAHRYDTDALTAAIGVPALACAAALLLRACGRRTPLVLDGLGAVAAGLLAHAASARAAQWWQVADRTQHPATDIATTRLGQRPILDLGVGPADGTAGALALLVLRTATIAGLPG